jgi:hypothetical protein
MGGGCIDPHFLHLGTSWRWVVKFTPRPLYPRGKSPRYPLDRRLGGLQSRSGRFGEEKIRDPTGTRTPTPRSSSPWLVAIPTTLSRLFFFFFFVNTVTRENLCLAEGVTGKLRKYHNTQIITCILHQIITGPLNLGEKTVHVTAELRTFP